MATEEKKALVLSLMQELLDEDEPTFKPPINEDRGKYEAMKRMYEVLEADLDYSYSYFTEVLRELDDEGYIKVVKPHPRDSSAIEVLTWDDYGGIQIHKPSSNGNGDLYTMEDQILDWVKERGGSVEHESVYDLIQEELSLNRGSMSATVSRLVNAGKLEKVLDRSGGVPRVTKLAVVDEQPKARSALAEASTKSEAEASVALDGETQSAPPPQQGEFDYQALATELLSQVINRATQAEQINDRTKALQDRIQKLAAAIENRDNEIKALRNALAKTQQEKAEESRQANKYLTRMNQLQEQYNKLQARYDRDVSQVKQETRHALPDSERRKLAQIMTQVPSERG